jgi:hypothetical protein
MTTITKQIEAIEERFDEEFVEQMGTQEWAYFTDQPKEIKSFYRQEITNLLTTLRAEVEKEKDLRFPQNMFADSYTGLVSRGVQESSYVRQISLEDEKLLAVYDRVLSIIDGKE